ncbi:unnamed protein product [Cuscuta campestris]|uniref:Transmembrane protein n=1 Tax=Cuscuta campestris TaxID=132261 RepID=A0A484K7N9_9ASTE|nr:unnamed protein product [Cuscuta campestris]
MGLRLGGGGGDSESPASTATHKAFLFCNYVLLGSASSCIFLTLSLRLFPSLTGFFLILLHAFTIGGAVLGCAAVTSAAKLYGTRMAATVLAAIFQGAVFILVFTRTGDFLGNLKSYVREEDGEVILRLAGGLSALIFCLEWVALTLAFVLKYKAAVHAGGGGSIPLRNGKVGDSCGDSQLKDWPWPFQV